MTTHVALLRAVNVAGTNAISMSDLRSFFEGLGFEDVRTLLQTGNVLFGAAAQASSHLEGHLETEASKRIALETTFFVRTAAELKTVIAKNPYQAEARRDPGHLVVQFMKDAPLVASVKALQDAIAGPEYVTAIRKQLYVVYPDGIGRSKLTTKLIETRLGTRMTGRNWNTLLKLAALAGA